MLQPRRIAARNSAARIAEERGGRLGDEIGYHVRLDRKAGPATRLLVMTEGILARQLLADPYLDDVAAIVLDEFHERSIHVDLALALSRELQQAIRPDLRLIVMSATLDAGPIQSYLGGCPLADIAGRTYPVDVRYAPSSAQWIPDQAIDGIQLALQEEGDVLCFLPGAPEIRRVQQWLETRHPEIAALPLYGALTPQEQQLAIRRQSRRRVILSTNVAETSLTIEGVRIVVDTGYARVARYDPRRGLDNLSLERISQASATQRAGRAGRTEPGICIRLWSAKQQVTLAAHAEAEIHRVDLAPTLLTLAALGWGDPRKFAFFQPPAPATIDRGWSLLERLGLVRQLPNAAAPEVTAMGKQAAAMGVHPRLGRMLVAAKSAGQPALGAAVAALLSEPDLLGSQRNDSADHHGPSDLAPRLALIAGHGRASADADAAALARIRQLARELLSGDGPVKWDTQVEDALLPRLALAAYPDRICLRRETDRFAARMIGGLGVRLSPSSRVQQSPFYVAVELRDDDRATKREAMATIAQAVSLEDIHSVLPHRIRSQREMVYDSVKDRVVARQQLLVDDLPLQSSDDGPIDPEAAALCLAAIIRPKLQAMLEANEAAAQVLARLDLARKHLTDLDWPDLTTEIEAGDSAITLCHGKRSLADVTAADLKGWLLGLLPWNLQQALVREIPEALTVPSGRQVKVDYSIGKQPILPVRLQEMFGCKTTPTIARGRVPMLIHLLSPGYKPVQVTQDLASFWANTYQQVRKDLRARYPKHAWPEDPHGAAAVARGPSQKRI